MKHPILKKRTAGGEGVAAAAFDVAIAHAWPFDAYIVQYTGAVRMNKADVSPDNPMMMVVELYDFDTPGHGDVIDSWDWANDALDALPPGFQGCLTAGGFRVWTKRAAPFVIDSPEAWEKWRAYHAGRAEALGKAIGAAPDHATDDPGRLFRLPNVRREDGKPCYPELVGELGVAELAPLPWERREATAVSTGPAGATMLGECFEALGWVCADAGEKLTVRCPWAHEHSKSGDDLAVVYATGPEGHGVGKFHCGHTHCEGRHTPDAIAALEGMPAVAEVLARWLYRRTDEPAPSASAPVVKASPKAEESPAWLTGAALAVEIPKVNWVIPALEIAPGRPTILAADANAGKSWGVQTIAVAVAAGLKTFGEFECRQGLVLHVAEDSDVLAVLDRYQQISRAWGVNLAELPLGVYNRSFRVCKKRDEYDPAMVEGLIKTAERHGAALVVVDSLAAVSVGLDENSPAAALPLYASRHPTIAFLWTHHTGKADTGEYRGSSTIRAAAGAMWSMTGSGKDPRQWVNRKHAERTSSKTRVGSFSTTWDEDTGRVVATCEPPPARDKTRLDVLRHLHMKGPSSGNGIEAEVVGRREKVRDAYKGLAQAGILIYDGRRYHIAGGVDVEKLLREGEGRATMPL